MQFIAYSEVRSQAAHAAIKSQLHMQEYVYGVVLMCIFLLLSHSLPSSRWSCERPRLTRNVVAPALTIGDVTTARNSLAQLHILRPARPYWQRSCVPG